MTSSFTDSIQALDIRTSFF